MRSERNPLLAPAMPMWSGRPRPLPLTFACRHEPAGAPFLARPLREKWEECRHQRHPIQSITPISPPLPPSSFRPTPKPKRVVVILRGCDFLNCHPDQESKNLYPENAPHPDFDLSPVITKPRVPHFSRVLCARSGRNTASTDAQPEGRCPPLPPTPSSFRPNRNAKPEQSASSPAKPVWSGRPRPLPLTSAVVTRM
jgi:hypothetical protein